MVKKIKKIKRRHRFRQWAFSFALFAMALWLISSIFLRSYQVSIAVETQNTQRKIQSLMKQNESLQIDIQRLSSYDRIVSLAKSDGFKLIQQNVITIP